MNLREVEQVLRRMQGSRIAMVYQDPQTALNPTFRVGDHLVLAETQWTPLGLLGEVMAHAALADLLDRPGQPELGDRARRAG